MKKGGAGTMPETLVSDTRPKIPPTETATRLPSVASALRKPEYCPQFANADNFYGTRSPTPLFPVPRAGLREAGFRKLFSFQRVSNRSFAPTSFFSRSG